MKSNPFDGLEIWFLTGSQDLYGDETLAQVAGQSQQVAHLIEASHEVPVKVVWKPVLTDSDAIRRCALDANSDDRCIGVIVWMHTFSPAKMWIRGLNALRVPLLHLHTQANVELPWDTIDMDFMNLNQAAHGDREMGYIQSRMDIPRKTVVGHASHSDVTRRIGLWARAATAWNELDGLRLTRFGDNMRNVAVTEGDKTEAEVRFGLSVNTWAVNDLVALVDAIDDTSINILCADYEEHYDVTPSLRKGGDRHESLRYGARQEIAMRAFLEENRSTAFTTNFEDLGGLRQLPGLAVQRLMGDGFGFGAEGDWKTAVLVRALAVMGHGLPGGASLMEDYTYDLTPGDELILGAHMLEVSPSLTTSKPSLEIHPLGIGDREDPVRLVFDTDPGPAIVIAMTDMRDRFRLTANTVNVLEPPNPLPKLPVARAVWKPDPSLQVSAECWLTAGAAHHTAMTTAVPMEAVEDFARIFGVELAVIDRDTTTRQFARELAWNATYHHASAGPR